MTNRDQKIAVGLEIGKKRVFASALDWPGWCRSGKDEDNAISALLDYLPRYQAVLGMKREAIGAFDTSGDIDIVERQPGTTTTDFGAPDAIFAREREPLSQADLARFQTILKACWQSFDGAIQKASGKELRKGPRGGGRDVEKIAEHVLGADQGYLSKLGWKARLDRGISMEEAFSQTRRAILEALDAAERGELPDRGPRGGEIWPARYYIRRSAWHVLDHAWEIEDRIL